MDIRTNYPKERKTLCPKSLHRKKLTLATNIHHIKKNLQDNKFPVQASFICNTPSNRDTVFRDKWSQITNDAKHKLTQLILDDLNIKYQGVKLDVQANFTDLHKLLTRSQFEEITKFLSDRYKATAEAGLNKVSKRINQRNPRRPQQGRARNFQQVRRPQNKKDIDNNKLKKLFLGLINSL